MLRENSRTFFAASLLLPRAVREPASALYAFCRLADDAVDLPEGGGTHAAVARLRERLERLYANSPVDHAADRAFADVARRYAIPRTIPEALLEGFEWDVDGRRYEDISDLRAYAARVAGTVGAMMGLIMGVRAPLALARACDLGVAMQLSNIARDVGEDARAGRLYLPLSWMREAGLEPDEWMRRPVFSEALGSVVQRLLIEADTLYARVGAGVAVLPSNCQPGINAARMLYAEIGREVERAGLNSVSRRAVVPAGRKAILLSAALLASADHRQSNPAVLPECQFLVDAVDLHAAAGADRGTTEESAPWGIEARAIWLIDLFDRLERRDREQSA
jgi:phytoene synthase